MPFFLTVKSLLFITFIFIPVCPEIPVPWSSKEMALLPKRLFRKCAILCKVLQEEEICIVRAIEAVGKTKKSLDKLQTVAFEELPTDKKVLGWINQEVNGSVTYQGVELKTCFRSCTYLKSNSIGWIKSVETCLQKRIKFQDTCSASSSHSWMGTK